MTTDAPRRTPRPGARTAAAHDRAALVSLVPAAHWGWWPPWAAERRLGRRLPVLAVIGFNLYATVYVAMTWRVFAPVDAAGFATRMAMRVAA